MECFIQLNEDGTIMFHQLRNNNQMGGEVQVFGKESYERGNLPSQLQLSLENNIMVLTLKYKENTRNIYHAGPNTNGTWFQFLSGNSVVVNAEDTDDILLPEMGYIRDLDGVFVILGKKDNWTLFNKTKAIWESGTTQNYESGLVLILTRDGDLALPYLLPSQRKYYFWSAKTTDSSQKPQLDKSESFVNNDGMWLLKTYTDGTINKYKALEGTNKFTLVSDGRDELEGSLSQLYKL